MTQHTTLRHHSQGFWAVPALLSLTYVRRHARSRTQAESSAAPSCCCVAHSRRSHASLPISPAGPIRKQIRSRVSAKAASALNKLRWRHTLIFAGCETGWPIIAVAAQMAAEKFELSTWSSFLPGWARKLLLLARAVLRRSLQRVRPGPICCIEWWFVVE